MSLASSVDLREFRTGGGDKGNEYAYADPMEEVNQRPRNGGRADRGHSRDMLHSNGFRDVMPIPTKSRGYPHQGPIITTPSMEMSLSRHPVTHQPRPLPQTPGPIGYPQQSHHYPQYPYPHHQRQTFGLGGQTNDLLIMCGALLMFFCCPLSILCTIPAVFCVCQGQQLDNQGIPHEGAARRNYAIILLCAGGVLGFLVEVVVAIVLIVIYVGV